MRLRESSGAPLARNLSSLIPASPGAASTVRSFSVALAMTTDLNQNASLLKAVVIGLGVAILLAVSLIVYAVVGRVSGSSAGPASATVALPAGSSVVSMTEEDDHLSLLIEDEAGHQQVLTIDRRSGAVTGILTLEPEP